ncbi:hypothetical protein CPB85DRAFT_404301 [Mucidula mucida]|nr:hypothetical protein CPB85DRAFT_404301 [Mucidula mucida]
MRRVWARQPNEYGVTLDASAPRNLNAHKKVVSPSIKVKNHYYLKLSANIQEDLPQTNSYHRIANP